MGGVRGSGGGEAGCGTGFVDAHVEELTAHGFFVREEHLAVDGEVVLPVRVVDLRGREERVDSEGAGLIGDDGHDPLAQSLLAHEVLEQPDEGHRRGRHLLPGALLRLCERLVTRRRQGDLVVLGFACRQESAELTPAVEHVLDLLGVLARVVVRHRVRVFVDDLVADRDVHPITEGLDVGGGELLHLVGGVAGLERRAQSVALDGLDEDDGGFALGVHGLLVGGEDLVVVVAAALEVPDVVIGQMVDEPLRRGGPTEEVVADEAAGFGLEGLVVPVEGLVHDLHEVAGAVLGQQVVPFAAPQHLDDVPAGAGECGFELLDDLSVSAHGSVEALEVAVDDEGEVVQPFVRGQLQGAARFGFVHLAVAEERPHSLVRGVGDAAVVQVAVHLRLVDRVDRTQTHRHGRELPEFRHQPRVRIRAQSVRCA